MISEGMLVRIDGAVGDVLTRYLREACEIVLSVFLVAYQMLAVSLGCKEPGRMDAAGGQARAMSMVCRRHPGVLARHPAGSGVG
jgi:hypothetical protein